MNVGAIIGAVGGTVGIAGAVIGYTKFVATAPLEARTAQLEGELKRQEERVAEISAERDRAREDLLRLKSSKGDAALVKNDIDAELLLAMTMTEATEASVLVPAPPPNSSSFVFLSIHGPSAAKIRKTKLPLTKGKAGKVFASGTPDNAWELETDPDFFGGVDTKSEGRTRTLLTLPIVNEAKVVGVLQLLNKLGGARFSEEDARVGLRVAGSIAARIVEFARDPQNFELLGLAPEQEGQDATVVFCDLTASSRLLGTMVVPNAIDCMNEYLERQCEVALRHGATVDKYLGDGAMIRFNVPRPITDGDHAVRAVEAACAMRADFEALKRGWENFDLDVGPVFSRVGIACGPVFEAVMGHPQSRQVTVIGNAVNEAANLCEKAPRGWNVIVVNDEVARRIDRGFALREVAGNGGATRGAREVVGVA
jgi:class 3 adenylate cyclase